MSWTLRKLSTPPLAPVDFEIKVERIAHSIVHFDQQKLVRLIYTFWSSLSFTSSILERLLYLSQHFEILLDHLLSCHFTIISNYFDNVCYLKQEVSFASISFEVQRMTTELKTFNHLKYNFTCHLSCKYS